jgi:hypothetical protein
MALKYLYIPSGVKAGKAYAVLPEIINTQELTNGNFEQGSTGWTLSGVQNANNYAVFSNGKLVLRNDGSSSGVSQDILTSGKSYDVELYVSEIVGNGFKVNVGAGINYEITTTGRIVFTIKATSSIFYLYRSEENPQSVNGGTIEVVSVLETGADFSDFTRSSAGSRVDKNGLINTGLGLGSEEVVNGGFDSSASWYTSIATISNSRATFIDGTGAYSNVRQPNVLATNKKYEVRIDVTINSGGGFKIQDGNSNTYKQITESGVYTFRFTSIGASSTFYISRNQGGVAYNMYVESVSVREVTEVNTHVPRLDHTGGGCPSLLLEPTSTNYVEYSEDFSQSYWGKGSIVSVSEESILNPKGTLGAYKVNANGTGSTFVRDLFSASAQTYTTSFFIKKGNHRYIGIRGLINVSGNDHIVFDFDTKSVIVPSNISSSSEYVSSGYEPYKNGWFKVYVTISVASAQSRYAGVCVSNSTGSESGTFSDAYFYVTCAQLEQQSYATSYIPTFGATSTRSADVAGGTGDISSVVNDDDFEIEFKFSSADDNLFKGITFSDTTSTGGSNYVTFYLRDNKSISNLRFSVGGSNTSLNIGNMPDVTVSRVYKLIKKATYLSLEIDGTEFGRINQSVTFTNALKYLKLKANDNDDSKGLRVDYIKINN